MVSSFSPDEARRELARRELARRRQNRPDAAAMPYDGPPQPPGPPPTNMPSARPPDPVGQRYDASGVPLGGDSNTTPMSAPGNGTVAAGQPQTPATDPVTRADNVIRGLADVFTFGGADELAAAAGAATGIGGTRGDYAGNVADQRAQDAQGGAARLAGQLAGAVLMPGAAARTTLGAARNGAVLGGAYGFGSGEGVPTERLSSAATGAAFGGAGGAAVRGIANALGDRAVRSAIPTTQDIKATAQAAYRAADGANVIVRPEGIQRLSASLKEGLANEGYLPKLQPRVKAVLDEVDRLSEGNVTFKGVDNLRRVARNVAGSTDPDEARIGTQLVRKIEGYMEDLPAGDVLTGNAAQAAQGFRTGQENWARFRRSEMIDVEAQKAARRAATSGTGGNVDNAMRQNVRSILDNPRRSRGMTAAERAAAERAVMGSSLENRLRQIGRLSPSTGGLSTMMTTGATMMNPLFGIPAVVGAGAKAMADRSTMNNVRALAEITRSGGKTAKQLAEAARRGDAPKGLLDAIAGAERLGSSGLPPIALLGAILADKAGY